MNTDIRKLKEKLIYSFTIPNEDICHYEKDYLESGKRQSIDSFAKDIINNEPTSFFEKASLFIKFNMITFLQIICFTFIIFIDNTNVHLFYTALFLYVLLDLAFITKVHKENNVLKMIRYQTNASYFIISFLLPSILIILNNTHFCYTLFEPHQIGLISYYTTFSILIFSVICKAMLSFFRYKYHDFFTMNLLLSASFVIAALYMPIYKSSAEFYTLIIKIIPYIFIVTYIVLSSVIFANKRKAA